MNNIFIECFGNLKDTPYKNKQHRLIDIVAIVICGILSGMKDLSEIAMFAQLHVEWFNIKANSSIK